MINFNNMNDTDKTLIVFFTLLATVLITLCLSITFYNVSQDKRVMEMFTAAVTAGESPLAASCAINNSYGSRPDCAILVAKMRDAE